MKLKNLTIKELYIIEMKLIYLIDTRSSVDSFIIYLYFIQDLN